MKSFFNIALLLSLAVAPVTVVANDTNVDTAAEVEFGPANFVGPRLEDAQEVVADKVADAQKALDDAFVADAKKELADAFADAKKIIDDAADAAQEALAEAGVTVEEAQEAIVEATQEAVAEKVEAAQEALADVADAVQEVAADTQEVVVEKLEEAREAVDNVVRSVQDIAADGVQEDAPVFGPENAPVADDAQDEKSVCDVCADDEKSFWERAQASIEKNFNWANEKIVKAPGYKKLDGFMADYVTGKDAELKEGQEPGFFARNHDAVTKGTYVAGTVLGVYVTYKVIKRVLCGSKKKAQSRRRR